VAGAFDGSVRSPTPAAFAHSARVFTGFCDFGNFAEVSPPVGVFKFTFAFRATISSRLDASMIRSIYDTLRLAGGHPGSLVTATKKRQHDASGLAGLSKRK